ncbi:ribbon-helix-helix domain-containing protein [Algicella marina]|uniref:Ribbon-helix-helix domain-containing protein n=1 Tax=Algicella marina TaxID=2683284 RepID=A0A6P1SZH5_9RHOB|nr:ribbon-helix-helix domain-containing protein [Algicella marina]QHQ34429.1 ribbon-helix-helix domain-containing protein [Algicella marina]
MKKAKITAYVDAALFNELDELSVRRRIPRTQIIEAALASFLSPDSAEQNEAAIVRRLDRLTRSLERLERDQEITTEALALFVRFWLTTTPPLPDDTYSAAKAKGKERYSGFVRTLSRRLSTSTTLQRELSHNTEANPNK